MASQKSSAGNGSQLELSTQNEVESGPRLDPQNPNRNTTKYDPQAWRGDRVSLVGFVVVKGKTDTRYPWVKIFCTELGTAFYGSGIHTLSLAKGAFVSFVQAKRVVVGDRHELGADRIRPLTRKQLEEENQGIMGIGRTQPWAQGTVRSIGGGLRFQPRRAIEYLVGSQTGKGQRLSYDTGSLVEGSHFSLPPGSPVFFQASLKQQPHNHNNKKQKQTRARDEAEVYAMVYDWSRYSEHAGPLPSQQAVKKVEGKVGKAHILLGSSGVIDPRGVSILDLLQDDDRPIEGASFESLLLRGLVILEERLNSLNESMQQNQQTGNIAEDIETLQRTINAHREGTPLHVFAFPNFITRSKLIDTVNRFFSFGSEAGDVVVGKVRILEMASAHLNVHNTSRDTGLIARLTSEWKVYDHQESHQLFRGAGPFVKLTPATSTSLDYEAPEMDSYRAVNTNHHHTHQLLLITLAGNTISKPEIECSVVNLNEGEPTSLELVLHPSILVVYEHSRRDKALALLSKFIKSTGAFSERVEYVDTRKGAARLYLAGADEDYVADVIRYINNPDAERLLRASNWDALHQDLDGPWVRTLMCCAGNNPPHDTLIEIDPDIQYEAIVHGVLRIKSTLPTKQLLTNMRTFNGKQKTLDSWSSTRNARGDRALFQAIRDDEGLHYVGAPPSPLAPRGNNNAWGGTGINGPIIKAKSLHRVIIKGPAPGWSPDTLRSVLTDFALNPEAIAVARWTSIQGEMGTFIEIAHDSVKDMQGDAKT